MDDVARRRLARRVQSGEYEIDPDAVAVAVLRRWNAEGTSAVLVAAQPGERLAVVAEDGEPGPGSDLA